MTKEINRMSQDSYFKLCMWLSNNVKLTSESTYVDIAKDGMRSLGFMVTESNVRAAFKTLNLQLPGSPKTNEQKVAIVAKAIAGLYQSLGIPTPADLSDIL